MTLRDLKPGQKGIVESLNEGDPALLSRIMALGIIPGEQLEVLRDAPLGDPMQVKAGTTFISIRRIDSQLINIIPEA
ncbi:MAG: ferrous iron transport protein A [Gammaproteobacteria bacterium]|nr:ferrous iron transport protein A [Gammaproteobacteria bacterium]NVK87632.1 ferrous iron transport protein A [Gammaproteobacteria bacterium]